MKNCLGIEIGHYRVKIAYMERGQLKKYISERIDSAYYTDMKPYAEFIQDVLREHDIRCQHVVFVLQQDDTYVKRFHLPLMTVDQLKLNLPYEFQDYIGNQIEEYQFDYGVIERTEESLDILAGTLSAVPEAGKDGAFKAGWSGPGCGRPGAYSGAGADETGR